MRYFHGCEFQWDAEGWEEGMDLCWGWFSLCFFKRAELVSFLLRFFRI